jgi:succinate--hydroxymethylglutarate CoA-transferase
MSGANGNTSSSSGEPSASSVNATTRNGFGSSSASSIYGASNGSTGPGSILNQPFSAATEAILRRIRGEGGLSGSTSTLGLGIGAGPQAPKYEDVRRSVLESMKTSVNIDIPSPVTTKKSQRNLASKNSPAPVSTPTSTSGGGGRKGSKKKQGTKRKRVKEEDEETDSESGDMSGLGGDSDSDGSGSITSMPMQTLSGRKVVRPIQYKPSASEAPPKKRPSYNMKRIGRNVEAALCKRCGRGHSPASNMIVFCDGCNVGWHQMCHDPMISNETVKDETKEWFCNDCTTKRASAQAKKASSATKPTSFAEMSFDEVGQ